MFINLSLCSLSLRQQLNSEEASVMGEFITRGIAIAFGVGATVALIARGHPMTRRHPNLIGLAAGATADAMTRDYRRPRIYDRLLRLDTPLGSKARGMVISMRTGEPEPTSVMNVSQYSPTSPPVSSEPDVSQPASDWWSSHPAEAESQPDTTHPPEVSTFGLPPPVQLPRGGPFAGTKTWDEIRSSQKPAN